jgi:hypothetical protein
MSKIYVLLNLVRWCICIFYIRNWHVCVCVCLFDRIMMGYGWMLVNGNTQTSGFLYDGLNFIHVSFTLKVLIFHVPSSDLYKPEIYVNLEKSTRFFLQQTTKSDQVCQDRQLICCTSRDRTPVLHSPSSYQLHEENM